MKKRSSALMVIIFTISGFMTGCRQTEPVIWNGVDISYWQQNEYVDGGFTVTIGRDGKACTQQGMNIQVTDVLLALDCTQDENADISGGKEYNIQLTGDGDKNSSVYIFFADDFSAMAVTDTYPGGPAVKYTIANGETVKELFVRYDILLPSRSAAQNGQLAELGVDFSYWNKTEDNNINQPLAEFGNGCVITIDADAGSAGEVVRRLESLQLKESDMDLSQYTNSVFIHRIALNTFEDRGADVYYNKAGHKYAYQFWFYDDFRYMRVTDGEENQLGPVFEISDNSTIKQLYIDERSVQYITPREFEKAKIFLDMYIDGKDKTEFENLPDSKYSDYRNENPSFDEFPEDFVFNVDYSNINMVVFQDDVNMINGFTDVNGVKHSYIFFVDKDESGNLVPEKITVMLWHE